MHNYHNIPHDPNDPQYQTDDGTEWDELTDDEKAEVLWEDKCDDELASYEDRENQR